MFSIRSVSPLLAAAGICILPAATPLSLVTREDQRLSVASLPAEFAAKSFGGRLQVSGDTAVFLGNSTGPRYWEKSIYIYVFQNGSWTFQQCIPGNVVGEYSEFAHSIALSGDTLVVSAPYEPKGELPGAGCLLVYERHNGTWTLQTKLFAEDAAKDDSLGDGVVIDGDTIMSLAHGGLNNWGGNAGSAYFFHRQNGIWTQGAELPTPRSTQDRPSSSPLRLALSGDHAAVGFSFGYYQGKLGAGQVFLFRRAGGVWSPDGILASPDGPKDYEFFGSSLAMDGETLLVSAVQGGAAGGEGKAFTYRKLPDGGWEYTGKLDDGTPDYSESMMRFGSTMVVVGDTAVIGGPNASHDLRGLDAGSAFVFRRNQSGSWDRLRRLLPEGTDNSGTGFGSAMALHGRDSLLIVGAEDDGTITYEPWRNNRGVVISLSLITPEGLPLRVLNLADTNHDETLSPLEWDQLFPVDRLTSTVFGTIDWNRSSSVDYLELDLALANPAAPPAYHLWMDYLQASSELDADGDLQLSRDELLRLYAPGKTGAKQADAFLKRLKIPAPITTAQWFRGKGLPTMAQYDAAIVARSQRGELAAQLDTDENGQVSRQEFAALFPVKVAVGKVDAAWRSATGTPKKVVAPAEISIHSFIEAPVLPKVKR